MGIQQNSPVEEPAASVCPSSVSNAYGHTASHCEEAPNLY